MSNFEVLVPRRYYFCGSKFIIRHSAVCFQLPLPANRYRLFNPAPQGAGLTCDSLASANASTVCLGIGIGSGVELKKTDPDSDSDSNPYFWPIVTDY